MAAPFFKDSHELRCNALKLRLQEVITQDHVVQEEEKKKRKKRVIQIIAWLAKEIQAPAGVAAHSLGLNVKEAV